MLTNTQTNEFSIFTQEIRKPADDKDEYIRVKVIKERAKVAKFFNKVLPTREVIISWKEGEQSFSTTATLNTIGYGNVAALPSLPDEYDIINGEICPAQKHIRFYAKPTMEPVLIEIDKIDAFIVVRTGIDDLIKEEE